MVNPREIIEEFLEADGATRSARFHSFFGALKQVSREDGPEAGRVSAARAMSPGLSYSSALALRRWLVPARNHAPTREPLRLAVLGGATLTQLVQLIETFLAAEGIDAEVFQSDYGVFRQEILGDDSKLNSFRPHFLFLATGVSDVSRFPVPGMTLDEVESMVENEAADWEALWKSANSRWNSTVIQNNFERQSTDLFGHHAVRNPAARENYLDRLNRAVVDRAPGYVLFHDIRGLAADVGSRNWHDPRFYFEAKMPCAPECLVPYAHSFVSLLQAALGKSKKVLVLDLDNTIWGGAVGDLGPGGLRLGQGTAEGEAFLAFQKHVKELRDRGILLAVCSKNDEAKAREPFLSREDMILKLGDFSCFVANWNNKVDNLREISSRLSLGTDSFVFFDDNPVERALVRRLAPEVSVPDVPEDPAGYVDALMRPRYFETVSFTAEDGARARHYAEDVSRREQAARAVDMDSFLSSLGMRARVEGIRETNFERANQLINKTNQFNLTTRRYSGAELRAIVDSASWSSLTLSLRDRFGDSGLISVILLRKEQDAVWIDTWVMSCRVLQRQVEQFALNEIVRHVRALGARRLHGVFIATPRNQMVENLYGALGFRANGVDGASARWVLELDDSWAPRDTHIEPESMNE